MEQGTVIRLIRDRGFGFVSTQGGKEIFFHHSTLAPGVFDSLREGQQLSFNVEDDARGRGERAVNVTVLD